VSVCSTVACTYLDLAGSPQCGTRESVPREVCVGAMEALDLLLGGQNEVELATILSELNDDQIIQVRARVCV
jgi:hypothetical protein